jgi:hypothetical protein
MSMKDWPQNVTCKLFFITDGKVVDFVETHHQIQFRTNCRGGDINYLLGCEASIIHWRILLFGGTSPTETTLLLITKAGEPKSL